MEFVIDEIMFLETLFVGIDKVIGWRFNLTLRSLLGWNMIKEATLSIVEDMILGNAQSLILVLL